MQGQSWRVLQLFRRLRRVVPLATGMCEMNGRFVAGKRHDSAPPSVSADNQEFPSLISGHAFVPHFSALGKKVEKCAFYAAF
jgi:hypothetical protein